jgi:hypothetical protein
MTLGRTEIAPVKVSAGIEQVDVNTSKLSLRFLLKVKWSDTLVVPYPNNIRRGLHQGWSLGGHIWRSVQL